MAKNTNTDTNTTKTTAYNIQIKFKLKAKFILNFSIWKMPVVLSLRNAK
jgi:hypothetical protein